MRFHIVYQIGYTFRIFKLYFMIFHVLFIQFFLFLIKRF